MTLLSVALLRTRGTGNLIRIYKVTDFVVPSVLLEPSTVPHVNTQRVKLHIYLEVVLQLCLEQPLTTATTTLKASLRGLIAIKGS